MGRTSKPCIIEYCENHKYNEKVSYFEIPDGYRGIVWLKTLALPGNTKIGRYGSRVCERHFKRTDFSGSSLKESVKRKRIIKTAVPHINKADFVAHKLQSKKMKLLPCCGCKQCI